KGDGLPDLLRVLGGRHGGPTGSLIHGLQHESRGAGNVVAISAVTGGDGVRASHKGSTAERGDVSNERNSPYGRSAVFECHVTGQSASEPCRHCRGECHLLPVNGGIRTRRGKADCGCSLIHQLRHGRRGT